MSQFQVAGMSCEHCVKAVTRAVREIHPAAEVDVDLAQGLVRVSPGVDDPARVAAQIEDEGYTVTAIDGRAR